MFVGSALGSVGEPLYIYIISLFIRTLKYNAVHKYTVLRWI